MRLRLDSLHHNHSCFGSAEEESEEVVQQNPRTDELRSHQVRSTSDLVTESVDEGTDRVLLMEPYAVPRLLLPFLMPELAVLDQFFLHVG